MIGGAYPGSSAVERALRLVCCYSEQVDELIAAQQLDLTENEYALLIGVCAHGAAWERAEAVLTRIARELTTLQEGTLAAVERFFRWGWTNQHTKYES